MVAHLLDDCCVSLDCENQSPTAGESKGVATPLIAGERVQVQAGDVEELAELADVADGGDAAEIEPANVPAPFSIGEAFLLSATLKMTRAKLNVQLDSAFR